MVDKFREECGIRDLRPCWRPRISHTSAYALQHRGQESAGIASADGTQIRVSKAMGYVNEAFDVDTLGRLPGSIAVGHVRYSTAGESRLANAQPIVVDSVHGQLAVAHNGNLVNAGEVRDALVREGAIFQTNSDTEVVVHLFARAKAEGSEAAIIEAISQVRGAFSLVMMTKDRLIGVRDPHGFRPLALGRLGNAWVVCSETCAMDLIGATYVRDVEPGKSSSPVRMASGPSSPIRLRDSRNASSSPFLAPGQLCVRWRASTKHAPSSAGGWRVSQAFLRMSSCRFRTPACARPWGTRKQRAADAHGIDSQSLRRPHVHSAAAVDSPFRRAREAQPGSQHPRRKARRSGGRLHRSRHDEPEDCSHGP